MKGRMSKTTQDTGIWPRGNKSSLTAAEAFLEFEETERAPALPCEISPSKTTVYPSAHPARAISGKVSVMRLGRGNKSQCAPRRAVDLGADAVELILQPHAVFAAEALPDGLSIRFRGMRACT